jgi:hypothetical protein
MPTVTTLERRNSDVFLEVPSPLYGLVSAPLRNVSGSALTLTKQELIGHPVKFTGGNYQLLVAGDEANATGLVFAPDADIQALANNTNTTHKFAILTRGPAVVNLANIKSGFTVATLITAFAGLPAPIAGKNEVLVTEQLGEG